MLGFAMSPARRACHMREAGATEVMVSSARRWALMHELRGAPEPALDDLVARMSPVDLLLVEGFKRQPHAKLEVHRPSLGKPLIYPEDPHVVAVATDEPFAAPLPLLPLSDASAIAAFITDHLGLGSWRS